MIKEFSFLDILHSYFTINPLSFILINFLNKISIFLYFLSVFNFYSNAFLNLIIELEIFILNTKNYNNEDFNNNFNNNFDDEKFYEKYEKSEYPRAYILPDNKIITRDWDKISPSEIFKRTCITKFITTVNKPNVDFGIKWIENFSKIYLISSAINIKWNHATNSHNLTDFYINNGIWAKFSTPQIEGIKIGLSFAYATYNSIEKNNIENYPNLKLSHSVLTQVANKSSPYTDTTFELNDTWDENKRSWDVLKEYRDEATKKYIEHITPGCEIF